jgi:hypothetical protein
VGEEYAASEVVVGGLFGDLLNAVDEVLVEVVASEFLDEFIVVDFLISGAGDGVGVDHEVIGLLLALLNSLPFLLRLNRLLRLCLFHQLSIIISFLLYRVFVSFISPPNCIPLPVHHLLPSNQHYF